jgi:hypothetical protein
MHKLIEVAIGEVPLGTDFTDIPSVLSFLDYLDKHRNFLAIFGLGFKRSEKSMHNISHPVLYSLSTKKYIYFIRRWYSHIMDDYEYKSFKTYDKASK